MGVVVLGGYLFTVLGAFTILSLVVPRSEAADISTLAGLNQRSPFLAGAMTLALVSLAGIPPLAGFFGKFLLLKAALEQGASHPAFYALVAIALVGVVISVWYYFGIIRAIYWSKDPADLSPIPVPIPVRLTLGVCIAGMLYLGVFPNATLQLATQAVLVLKQ